MGGKDSDLQKRAASRPMLLRIIHEKAEILPVKGQRELLVIQIKSVINYYTVPDYFLLCPIEDQGLGRTRPVCGPRRSITKAAV